MIYETLDLVIVLLVAALALYAGFQIGQYRELRKHYFLLEDSDRGDSIRGELGLYLEWGTPDASGEVARLVSPWQAA